MTNFLLSLFSINRPENPDKEVTLDYCTGCGYLDGVGYDFYKARGYKIHRRITDHNGREIK